MYSVVLVDELDQMLSKRQEVLYNFFNWPTLANSNLVVIAVADTMDLPERVMTGRVRSRLGESVVLLVSVRKLTVYTARDDTNQL